MVSVAPRPDVGICVLRRTRFDHSRVRLAFDSEKDLGILARAGVDAQVQFQEVDVGRSRRLARKLRRKGYLAEAGDLPERYGAKVTLRERIHGPPLHCCSKVDFAEAHDLS